jgi:CHAT domain-containing protein/tetratricopeptide (TPR) repeat protein
MSIRPDRHSQLSVYFPLLFVSIVLVPVFVHAVFSQPSANPQELVQGKRISRTIKSGEKQFFEMAVAANTAASVLVEQNGVDVAVRLIEVDGSYGIDADLDPRRNGKETLEFVSDEARTWKVEVRAFSDLAAPYSYDISISRTGPATAREKSLFEGRSLAAKARGLLVKGQLKESIETYEKALASLEALEGANGFNVGVVSMGLGLTWIVLGDLEKSFVYNRRALSIFEKTLSPDDLMLSTALFEVGRLEMYDNNFAECEALYLRSLAISEKVLGPDHPDYAQYLSELGVLYYRRAELDRAEETYEKALRIIERRVGKDDIQLAQPLKNVGNVRFVKGDYPGAAEYDGRALEICRKKCPENRILSYMFSVAEDYVAGGQLQEAETMLNETLSRYEKLGDERDPDWPNTMATLGSLYLEKNDLEKARPQFLRAIGMAEKLGGYSVSPLTRSLIGYAELQIRASELDGAEKSLERALKVVEGAFVPDDSRFLNVFNLQIRLNMLKGNTIAATELQERVNKTIDRNLALNIVTGTEQQRLFYLQGINSAIDQAIALDVDKRGGAKARDLAVSAVLQRKGRVMDAVANTLDQMRKRSSPEDLLLFQRLKDTNTKLARFILDGRGDLSANDYTAKVAELQKQKDTIEVELSRRTAGYLQGSKAPTAESIRALIPENAALIEFATYKPLESDEKNTGARRYVAYVIKKTGEPLAVQIGATPEIDALISQFRSASRDPRRLDFQTISKKVYARLIAPMRTGLGNARHLIVSPEGEMNLMPFEALIAPNNKFLVEDLEVSYVTSGRDLVRMAQKRESRSVPAVFADPDFGESQDTQVAALRKSPEVAKRSVTVTRELSGTYFAPLRGTSAEADSIRKFFPDAKIYTSRRATEGELKAVKAPRILHVATHGFFLTDPELRDAGGKPVLSTTNPNNPLLRSGLALFGANVRAKSVDDGLVTALEASGLDLWGTKLVVLSACDTGVGDVHTGEGVYGLRRAIAIAGAESLVMSLWPVSDYATRELMTNYYRNLKNGLGRGEALRQVKLQLIKKPNRKHPFYWASFIQAGEWANLDGKR